MSPRGPRLCSALAAARRSRLTACGRWPHTTRPLRHRSPGGRHFQGTRAPSYPATAASRQILDTPRAEAVHSFAQHAHHDPKTSMILGR
jgi:hypothetical protein